MEKGKLCLREAGAGGSNPLTPTNKVNRLQQVIDFYFNSWDKFGTLDSSKMSLFVI